MLFVLLSLVVNAEPGFSRVPTPADASTYAVAVSADGSTVVGQLGFNDGRVEAFRWRIGDAAIEGIGDLEGGLHFSSASAVSADGSIVAGTGFRGDPSRPEDGLQVAWTFTTAGGFVVLADLAGGDILANSTAISRDGRSVVGASYGDRNDFIAVRWTDGEIEDLGTFASESPRSDGRGISGDGTVIIGGSLAGFGAGRRTASFRKVGDGPLEDLGDLDGGANFCSVVAVSDNGRVIVGSASSGLSGDNYLEAFRKVDDGPLEPLGDLDGGAFSSDALDVSSDGAVIVGRSVINDNEEEEAFLFTDADGMHTLRAVAEDAGIVIDAAVLLGQATSVSDDGTVIVGNAVVPDDVGVHVEAFVVVLPAAEVDEPPAGEAPLQITRPSCGGCSGTGGDATVVFLLVGFFSARRRKDRIRGSRREAAKEPRTAG